MADRRSVVLIAGAILAADRILKAVGQMLPDGLSVPLIPGVAEFTLFKNTGIAFSLAVSGPIVWIASLGLITAVVVIGVRDLRRGRDERLLAYALFVLGASSNLFDRLAYGYTVDYLLLFKRSAVNLADAMILAGAFWLFFTPATTSGRSRPRS